MLDHARREEEETMEYNRQNMEASAMRLKNMVGEVNGMEADDLEEEYAELDKLAEPVVPYNSEVPKMAMYNKAEQMTPDNDYDSMVKRLLD